MKSEISAELTLKNQCNKSTAKQQYSFTKEPRFVDRLALAKTILDKFYDVNEEKRKLGGFFNRSKRASIQSKEKGPSPDHYNPRII
jgi:hypothetical protein